MEYAALGTLFELATFGVIATILYVVFPNSTTGFLFGISASGPVAGFGFGALAAITSYLLGAEHLLAVLPAAAFGWLLALILSTRSGARRGREKMERQVRSVLRAMPRSARRRFA